MNFLLGIFDRVYRLDRWMRSRCTPAGRLVLGVMVISGLFGIDTRQSGAYQLFSLLFALLLFAVAATWRFRPQLAVRRMLPPLATAGESLEYVVEVENRGTRALRDLRLRDELEDLPPDAREFRGARAPGDAGRNWFDRRVGYPRWLWLRRRKRGGDIDEAALPEVAAGRRATVRLRLKPLRRGRLRFRGTRVARPDPLGLLNARWGRPDEAELVVLPRRYPLPRVMLPGARRYQPGGMSLASRVGDSEEFVALREYRPGDARKRIHWKSWARLGRPIVKEFQEEFFERHALVLDTFAAPGQEEAFEAAVSVAASFASTLPGRDSLLDLMFVEERTWRFTAGRNLGETEGALRLLAFVQPCRDKPFARLADAVVAAAGELAGAVLVLLAWDEARRALAERVQSRGVPVLAIVVTAPGAAPPEPGPEGARLAAFRVVDAGRVAQGLARL